MAKHMKEIVKEKVQKGNVKFFIMIIVFLIIIIIPTLGKKIEQNYNVELSQKNEDVSQTEELISEEPIIEEKYIIQDLQNFSFQNAEIKTENGISYINIEVKNNSSEKSQSQKIMIILSGKTKQMQMEYTLPEIESNQTYKMQLSVIDDLSDIEVIEIKT